MALLVCLLWVMGVGALVLFLALIIGGFMHAINQGKAVAVLAKKYDEIE